MKIFLVGPFPPTYGGVSIHLKRLNLELVKNNINVVGISTSLRSKNEGNIEYQNLKKFFLKSILLKKNEILHVHLSGYKIKIFLGILSLLKKNCILTIHGEEISNEYVNLGLFKKIIYRFFLRKITFLMVVNENIKKECLKLGVLEDKIINITPYISPTVRTDDILGIDKSVWEFINNSKERGNVIITGNGNIRFFNSEDLYGLDMLIDVVYILKMKNYKVSLIFVLLGYEEQSFEERKYFNSLLERIEKLRLKEDVLIYKCKDTEYYPILNKTDIFIRPTNTDGYGISICEALSLNKISIASDVCPRENGTILFKSRDINDLVKKVEYVLNNFEIEKSKLRSLKIKDGYKDILRIYRRC